jgi:hypothetical protein
MPYPADRLPLVGPINFFDFPFFGACKSDKVAAGGGVFSTAATFAFRFRVAI